MRNFILVQFAMSCLGMLIVSGNIGGEHPRVSRYTAGSDWLRLAVTGSFLAWEAWLLWGGAA
jgi:hypothetical protein